MTKEQIIQSINSYVDQIIEEYKFKQFSRYVKSKKVEFEESCLIVELRDPLIYGRTKSRWEQKIYVRTYKHRKQKEMRCSCPDFRHRLEGDQVPCKHLFALIGRYQSKRSELIKQL